MPIGGPQWLLVEGEEGGIERAVEELRVNILARLAAEQATLHKLLDDLRRLVDAGLQPPGYTIRDVVVELRLYREAGVVYEDPDTARLCTDLSLLDPKTRSVVHGRSAAVAEVLGLGRDTAAPSTIGQEASIHA